MGMTGFDIKIRVYAARRICALNSKTSANDEAQEAAAYREYFSNAQFAYATA